jgi:hypothetical protein
MPIVFENGLMVSVEPLISYLSLWVSIANEHMLNTSVTTISYSDQNRFYLLILLVTCMQ